MQSIFSSEVPEEILNDHSKLPVFMLGAKADFVIDGSGKTIRVLGIYEKLIELCEKFGGPGGEFSFQDTHNIPGEVCHVVVKNKKVSCDDVMLSIAFMT